MKLHNHFRCCDFPVVGHILAPCLSPSYLVLDIRYKKSSVFRDDSKLLSQGLRRKILRSIWSRCSAWKRAVSHLRDYCICISSSTGSEQLSRDEQRQLYPMSGLLELLALGRDINRLPLILYVPPRGTKII